MGEKISGKVSLTYEQIRQRRKKKNSNLLSKGEYVMKKIKVREKEIKREKKKDLI